VFAQSLANPSWLSMRVRDYGDAPVAFVLTAASCAAHSASRTSRWFGQSIFWTDEAKLGWRLGIAAGR
jgi:hypothetical protein